MTQHALLKLSLLALLLTACTGVHRPAAKRDVKTAIPHMTESRFEAPKTEVSGTKGKPHTEAEWGDTFYQKGDFRRAVAYLSEAVKKDQGNATLWRNLGSAYAMSEDFDNSILCFERALKRNPRDTKSLYNLSLVHGWKGSLPEAESAAKNGLTVEPNHSGLHSSLGNIYADEAKEDDALVEYATALKLNPKDPVTLFNRGGLLFKRRDLRKAEEDFSAVLKLQSTDVEAAQNLAAVYILQNRMGEAEKLNRWVIKQKPKDEDTLENAYFNLGIIYDKQNKLEQALNMYKLALQVAPWDAAAYVNTAVILENLKRKSEALAYWEKYQRLFPASRRAEEITKRVEILRKMVALKAKPKGKVKGDAE